MAENSNKWNKIKKQVVITSKMNNRISQMNFIGEDLKFSEDSFEGRVAITLQLGISQIKQNNRYNSIISSNNSRTISTTTTNTTTDTDMLRTTSIPSENNSLINKYSFVVNGQDCIFTEYYPEIFSTIRSSLDIDIIEYKAVLGLNARTQMSKLEVTEEDLFSITSSSSSSPAASLEKVTKNLDKKINKSLKTAKTHTETIFRNISNHLKNENETETDNQKRGEIATNEEETNEIIKLKGSIKNIFNDISLKLKRPTDVEGQPPSTSLSSTFSNLRDGKQQQNDPENLKMIRSTLRFIGTKDASGKSSSWFLFSPDMRYCCKTAKETEAELLMKILPSYSR